MNTVWNFSFPLYNDQFPAPLTILCTKVLAIENLGVSPLLHMPVHFGDCLGWDWEHSLTLRCFWTQETWAALPDVWHLSPCHHYLLGKDCEYLIWRKKGKVMNVKDSSTKEQAAMDTVSWILLSSRLEAAWFTPEERWIFTACILN